MIFVDSMELEDLPAVVEMEKRSHGDPWSRALFLEELSQERACCRVARLLDDGKDERRRAPLPPAGYVCFREVAGEIQLFNVTVHPDRRRRGVGRALMEFVLARAVETGASKVLLEVRRGNEGALRFYEKTGFRRVGERAGYYDETAAGAAVLMELDTGIPDDPGGIAQEPP